VLKSIGNSSEARRKKKTFLEAKVLPLRNKKRRSLKKNKIRTETPLDRRLDSNKRGGERKQQRRGKESPLPTVIKHREIAKRDILRKTGPA